LTFLDFFRKEMENGEAFLPDEKEKKRVFDTLTGEPRDEDHNSFCVFQKQKPTEAERKRRLAFHRIYYRGKTYDPKRLMLQWYFPEQENKNATSLFCKHSDLCVNPFHLKRFGNPLQAFLTKEEERYCSPAPSLANEERKRKASELEALESPLLKKLEENAFARVKSVQLTFNENNALAKRRFERLFERDND
jgi:hypothetical protein